MKAVRTILIIALVLVIIAVAAVLALFGIINHRKADYYKYASPAGELEKKYTEPGAYGVSSAEFDAGNDTYVKYEVWYPSGMKESRETYPLVIMANGTGTKASQYEEVFKHLASWGFIVAGNEDENSRTGASSAATLDFMLSLNRDESSIFYGKIDARNIGIAGHSQGGVGAINAVTVQPNGTLYKAVFTASATSGYWGQDNVFGAEWSYDTSKLNVPYFMVAGAGSIDAGTAADITATEGQGICPLWSMTENYNALPPSAAKVMARAAGKDHGDMLRYSDAYMTAWFMYWLKEDTEAGKAFFGGEAEIMSNPLYQDQQSYLPQ